MEPPAHHSAKRGILGRKGARTVRALVSLPALGWARAQVNARLMGFATYVIVRVACFQSLWPAKWAGILGNPFKLLRSDTFDSLTFWSLWPMFGENSDW